jgi:hypothetical protein
MSASLETFEAPDTRRHIERSTWVVFGLVLVPTAAGLIAVIWLGLPAQVLFAFPLLLGLLLVLRSPVLGLYGLLAAALVIPAQPLGFPDSFIDNIPFFINLSDGGSLNVSGLGITPAEILMVVTFIGMIASLSASGERIAGGRLMIPYLVFGGAVVMGEANGLVHGGDFKLSLWELRPQIYGLAVFVMATALIRDRSQLKHLLVILLISEAFVGGIGTYRYFVTLNRNVGSALPILGHEDSFLLGLFVVAIVIGLIWFRRPLLVLLIAVAPLVITTIIVNHRRAGIGAVGVEIVTVMVLAYVLEPRLRGVLLKIGVVSAVLGLAFVGAFWNQQSGSIAELIRPIKSLVDPSARDLSSDLYRIAETANLKLTFRSSPLFGIGFGHPYYVVYPQEGVAKFDPLWNIIPHNSLLWVPMRMGIVGLVTFWGLIAMAIVEAIWMARAIGDKLVRGALVLALATIFGVLFFGYFDIGIESYRNLIVLGLVIAIINRASHLARDEQPPAHRPEVKILPAIREASVAGNGVTATRGI